MGDFLQSQKSEGMEYIRVPRIDTTIAVSGLQYTLAGETTKCKDSRLSGATPILRNNTGTRVCGIRSANTSSIRSCCDGEVQLYWCNAYCETSMSAVEFSQCFFNNTNTDAIYSGFTYCQDSISSTQNETIQTSFGVPRTGSPPRVLLTLFLTLLAVLLPPPSCKYASQGEGIVLTATVGGTSTLGSGAYVNTGTTQNNRTVNDTSAAEPGYDAFFNVLANLTGRRYPALSGISVHMQWASENVDSRLYFYPYRYCVNGTVSGCGDAFGDDDAQLIEACGPLFGSDWVPEGEEAATEGLEAETPQGSLRVVNLS
ncbi:hypothetical protein LA080_007219 [Diaporthe eres]|nr:hypothetical protein LA080_007219 [Diaporthe eres]